MCDCSLHHVASRSAKVGDKLVTVKFVNTPTGRVRRGDERPLKAHASDQWQRS